MPEQFRIATLGEPRAPWRDSYAEAMADAKALELASYDRSRREWFLAVPVEMQRRGAKEHPEPRRRDRHRAGWTDDDIAELRALACSGENAPMIARRMGRTAEAISKKARELGVALIRSR